MDRRQSPRVTAWLPVQVWGVDANSLPFMQVAAVRNISSGGAVVRGLQRQVRPGEILELRFDHEKAQFRAIWVGKPGSARQGEVGLEAVSPNSRIWDVNLGQCVQVCGNS